VEGRPLDDRDLAGRAAKGDVEAYEALVARYSDLAFRTAYVITGSAADAEDVVQEALVKAHRALPSFRAAEPFRPWLLRIVANEARNRRRWGNRWWRRTATLAPNLQLRDPARSPEEAAEEREQLLRSLNAMSAEDRAVVTCRYLLELTTEETAAALGWPDGTVKSRLSRALGRLRQELEATA
jgi:RNA polymerase sigma-70 factor (ECF subfamily)